MNILKKILYGIGGLFVLFTAIALIIPTPSTPKQVDEEVVTPLQVEGDQSPTLLASAVF